MDHPEPKTRKECKGGKQKDGPYSARHVRLASVKEAVKPVQKPVKNGKK
jgi:hypothetical protein